MPQLTHPAKNPLARLLSMLLVCASWWCAAAATNVVINLNDQPAPFPHNVLTDMMGSGHAALTLRPDWRQHMTMARQSIGVRSVRFHGIFDDDMNVVSRNKTSGGLLFNWTSIDSTLDFLVRGEASMTSNILSHANLLTSCVWLLRFAHGALHRAQLHAFGASCRS